jgi:signal transduction histidine kinase
VYRRLPRVARDADLLILEQALGNLLDNALKFSPPKAVVTVAVRETGGRAELSVVDSGPGIPQVDQQRVFERFYRTESSRSTEGTGLGLAIVKHVVLLHRGTVTLASPPVGKTLGTKFRIVLP